MGLFVEKELNVAPVEAALVSGYTAQGMDQASAENAAAVEAPKLVERAAAGTRTYNLNRIIFALGLFFVLLVIAIAAEAFDWVEDPVRIYDFAGLAFALVIGYLGGESAS